MDQIIKAIKERHGLNAETDGLIVAITGDKGGVGKSTIACSLATEFAALTSPAHVLLWDLDRNQTSWSWAQARKEKGVQGVTCIADIPKSVEDLEDRLGHLAMTYPILILDLAGGKTPLSSAAIAASDHVIMPTQASANDLELLPSQLKVFRSIAAAVSADRKIELSVILNNVPHNQPGLRRDAQDYLLELGIHPSGILIQRKAWRDIMNAGQGINEQGTDGKAAAEFHRLFTDMFPSAPVSHQTGINTMPKGHQNDAIRVEAGI